MSPIRISRILLTLVAILIAYGSLYPFHFKAPQPGIDSISVLFESFGLFSSRGDVLGNIVLFFPYGFLLVQAAPAGRKSTKFVVALIAGGVLLAAVLQWAQIYIPTRTAAIGDIVWNAAGMLAGLLAARFFSLSGWVHEWDIARKHLVPSSLLIFWLMGQWLPLVPTLDFQHIKDAVRPLFSQVSFDLGAMLISAAGIMAVGGLVRSLVTYRHARWLTPFAAFAAIAAKPFIVTQSIDWSTLAGLAAGYFTWLLFSFAGQRNRRIFTWFVMVLAWSVGTLSPLEFSGNVRSFNWVPFAALLEGGMLINTKSMAQWLFLYATTIWLAREMGARTLSMSIALALWVACLEGAQTLFAGHSPDITQSLLVLLAGLVLKYMSSVLRQHRPVPEPPAPSSASPPRLTPQEGRFRPLLYWLGAAAAIAIPLWLALRLPGIPYNVRELFLGGGNIFAVWVFAMALLWLGAGSVLLGKKLRHSHFPVLTVFPWAIAVSLICLVLLYFSVTSESLDDIAGSTNVYWFVVNRDMWGQAWRALFLSLPTESVVAVIERGIRFAALIGPLMLSLAILPPAEAFAQRGILNSAKNSLWLLANSLPYFLLCKIIAFDWSSTDNLNELVARGGAWGMGGGFYLYLLLALIAANATFLANYCRTATRCAIASILTLVLLPLGWVILGGGLEQSVEKYGLVFSGQQFLLGPDREHALSEAQLFARWAVLQFSAVVVLAAGVRLGQMTLALFGNPDK